MMAWLFSDRGIDKGIQEFNDFIRVIFPILFYEEIDQIAENLEDLAEVDIHKFQINEINELTDIILHSFWHSLPIQKQWDLLSQWPEYKFIYQVGSMLFLKDGI